MSKSTFFSKVARGTAFTGFIVGANYITVRDVATRENELLKKHPGARVETHFRYLPMIGGYLETTVKQTAPQPVATNATDKGYRP